VTTPTPEPTPDLVLVPICDPCIRGEGKECHTPDCGFWMCAVPPDGANDVLLVDLAAHDAQVRAEAAERACDVLQRLRGGDIEQEYIDTAIESAKEDGHG
jgi:hypothetical protein